MAKKINGFRNLTKKAFAVILAATGSLISSESKAQVQTQNIDNDDHKINYETSNKRILKPKLVLKVNMNKPENSLLAFHSSHSSHASHGSHSSHYSSSSSGYSSTPSYVPPKPIYRPVTTEPSTIIQKSNSLNNSIPSVKEINKTLYKGCEGTDVEDLQRLLTELEPNLTISITGYFGDQTEIAVKQFQKENELKPDGRVGTKTLNQMKKKKNGL